MNPDTGHLLRITEGSEGEDPALQELLERDYQEISDELAEEAEIQLDGQTEIDVDLISPSLLSRWAVYQRRRKERHNRRKRWRQYG